MSSSSYYEPKRQHLSLNREGDFRSSRAGREIGSGESSAVESALEARVGQHFLGELSRMAARSVVIRPSGIVPVP
jgi:hypothetical protein